MSWVTVIWAMVASACFTLALLSGLTWWQRREASAQALFTLSAAATGAFALCELGLMRASTPEQFGTILRWMHVPVWVQVLSLVGFVRLHFRAGRPWLAWAVGSTRTLGLILNFISDPSINYLEITSLRPIPLLGESVATAVGQPNPWMLVGQLSLVLLVIYVADATITVWRRGEERLTWVGVSIFCFTLAGAAQAVLVVWGFVHWPITASLFYQGVIVTMGYELNRDLLRAARLTAELQESEGRMNLAAAASGLAVWRWDIAQDSIWISGEGRPLYGLRPDEQINLGRFFETLHADDREHVRQALNRSLSGDGSFHSDYRVLVPDGTVQWIGAHGRVEFDSAHRPLRMHGVSLDVTDHKLAEFEAERHRGELAQLARANTLNELSGSLAQDLNQPLGTILTKAQGAQRLLLESPPHLAEVRELLAEIVNENRRASQVIQRLRTLLRRGDVRFESLRVNEAIESVVSLARADLMGRGVTLTQLLTADLPAVRGDTVQIQQVMLNLILNACDAMAGRPTAERRLGLASALRDGEVRVSVSDSGMGLPTAAGRIFEPFFTTKLNGLGLGLTVCRSIAISHRGRLWGEANPDRGATFHLSLPVAKEES